MQDVPQIMPRTGVSADYINEYFGKAITLETDGISGLEEQLAEHPVRTYTQRFPPHIYKDPVTEQNRERIARLDELAQ